MDDRTHSRHEDHGNAADTDSQAVEPRGRLGPQPHHGPAGAGTNGEKRDPRSASSPGGNGAHEPHDTPAPGGNGSNGARDEGERDPDDPRGPEGNGTNGNGKGEEPGSGKSFLLGLAWWP
ncbi:hypothetical protein [Sphaerisporangium fuscum]|uniref:hypothetical protein n=1 Tax=Sphaerisporangium fuscum TaxID=2835868 RepID=UPI001BDC91E7|nr:hypothetical protein [Sphaerisporangium fuscum]